MQVFRILVAIGWLFVMWLSLHAVQGLGLDAAGATFINDFTHPWRAQFNGDFATHLLLMAAWMIYREKNLLVGILCGVASVLLGGAFSLAYIFVATFTAKGNARALLLGHRTVPLSASSG